MPALAKPYSQNERILSVLSKPKFLKKDKRVSIRVSLKAATSKLADFSYVQLMFVC